MSLATSSGGGGGIGGGGLSMATMAAHNTGANAMATQQAIHAQIPGGGGAGGGGGAAGYGAAPGTSYAALGADLLDKNQQCLSSKSVRNAAKYPIVALDLYGDDCHVAYFPPMEKEEGGGGGNGEDDEMAAMMAAVARMKKGVRSRSAGTLGNGGNLLLKKDDDAAYKAVRRYLSKGGPSAAVLDEAIIAHKDNKTKEEEEEEAIVVIPRPHLLLGARSLRELNPSARRQFALPDDNGDNGDNGGEDRGASATSAVIDRAAGEPVTLATIAMDGNATPKGDDFDRVALQAKLHSKKKVLTMLPDEAVALLIAQARRKVHQHHDQQEDDDQGDEQDGSPKDEEECANYPTAFALPGWATLDATAEALIDAASGGPSLHQRSIAACVGALLPPLSTNKINNNKKNNNAPPPMATKLLNLLADTCAEKDKLAAKEAAVQAALQKCDPVEPDPYVPLVVLVGATQEGVEVTAVQLSKKQSPDQELHCPYGNINVISSVCRCYDQTHYNDMTQDAKHNPLLKQCMDKLREQVGVIVPESEEPLAMVTYGTISTQLKLASSLKSILTLYGKQSDDDDYDGWDQDIPIISTKEECVSSGLAILSASVHGRVKLVVSEKSKDGKHRPKAKLAVSVQDVSTSSVAISFHYFGGNDTTITTNNNQQQKQKQQQWTTPKIIFDFDRRVPAGPYQLDFSAAECAAHVKHVIETMEPCIQDENDLIVKAKQMEGSRSIPLRESAALDLRCRIYQKSRDFDDNNNNSDNNGGGWIRVGDDLRPLSMEHSQKEEGESGQDHLVACESAVLEISLGPTGLITTGLITNGETIVQATKSARNSRLFKYISILSTILFVGGFLVKSYLDEKIFERDTARVMAYYKHAAPNSFHDGDERQARYLVWKYKGKKEALWRRLEAKYGVPVKQTWEWEEEEENNKEEEEEQEDDLDEGKEGDEL